MDGALEGAESFVVGYGGDTSNFLIAAARSGGSTGYVTRVGDDAFGTVLTRLWEREGVGTAHVSREAGGRTGIYFIARGPAGHGFTYYRADSPASRLSPADVSEQAVARAWLLHVTGITQAISTVFAGRTYACDFTGGGGRTACSRALAAPSATVRGPCVTSSPGRV